MALLPPSRPVDVIKTRVVEVLQANDLRNNHVGLNTTTAKINQWHHPPPHWVKLSMDGSVQGQENKAGARGIIRTADGKWVFGFQHFIGCTTVVAAELWALWISLQLTCDGGFRAVVVETGSLDAIKAVGIIDQMDPNFNICQEIRDLMSRDWQRHLQAIRHVANECADSLAKTVVHQVASRVVLRDSSSFMQPLKLK
ncbi:uncharacterized protein LOC114264070 [Camellia sinensis]|uniref:uncharacterized protein LOC114264070 n=1 Tax=Camellia sinensis TaxID=4442 RepID=UPI001036B8F0|nr:uncharacterized protein LOC114264070 [Camellia sinensis]